MNKEKILERIKTLEIDKENAKASFIACEGALQDCQHWLKELDKNVEDNTASKPSKSSK
jgi:bifunctional pyridoxal-dependent enzyme with beta-cystathionase and maltose regulon repressor activities